MSLFDVDFVISLQSRPCCRFSFDIFFAKLALFLSQYTDSCFVLLPPLEMKSVVVDVVVVVVVDVVVGTPGRTASVAILPTA